QRFRRVDQHDTLSTAHKQRLIVPIGQHENSRRNLARQKTARQVGGTFRLDTGAVSADIEWSGVLFGARIVHFWPTGRVSSATVREDPLECETTDGHAAVDHQHMTADVARFCRTQPNDGRRYFGRFAATSGWNGCAG